MNHGVRNPGLSGARSLIEVARVLAQKRGQDGASNHDVAEAIGGIGAVALTETLSALTVVRSVTRLLDGRKECDSGSGDRVAGDLQRKAELQFGRERNRIGLVDDIEIGNDAQDA